MGVGVAHRCRDRIVVGPSLVRDQTVGPSSKLLGSSVVQRSSFNGHLRPQGAGQETGLISGGLPEAVYAFAALPTGAMTPVVLEPVFGRVPGGQTAVFGEARAFAVATFEPA